MKEPPWSGRPPGDEREARERLVQATQACLARHGADKTGMADIAAAAGVSRPTIYRYYAGLRELVREAVMVSAEEFVLRVAEAVERVDDPIEMVVEAIVFVTREIPRDPVLRAAGGDLPRNLGFGAAVSPEAIGFVRRALAPVESRCPQLSPEEFDSLCELVQRLSLTLLVAPGEPERTESQLRDALRGWLGGIAHLVPCEAVA